jgi:hypothetical protein
MLQFIANALLGTGNECCPWPYAKHEDGYGWLSIGGRQRMVHRFICEVVHGMPQTQKHEVAHNCGVPACINPRHLRWDTRKGNHADKIIHGTAQRGERANCVKLTAAQVMQIRTQPHKSSSLLAAEFGVDSSNVRFIRNRKTWRHI